MLLLLLLLLLLFLFSRPMLSLFVSMDSAEITKQLFCIKMCFVYEPPQKIFKHNYNSKAWSVLLHVYPTTQKNTIYFRMLHVMLQPAPPPPPPPTHPPSRLLNSISVTQQNWVGMHSLQSSVLSCLVWSHWVNVS